jgi:hypothetical protein
MVLPKKNFDRRFEEDHLFLLTFARLEISGGRRAVISVVTGIARVDIRDVFPNNTNGSFIFISLVSPHLRGRFFLAWTERFHVVAKSHTSFKSQEKNPKRLFPTILLG